MREVRSEQRSRVLFSDLACAFAALLPGFGYFGFLLMGKRSGRTRYRHFAKIYGAAYAVLALLFVLYRTWDLVMLRMTVPYYVPADVAAFLFGFGDTGRVTYLSFSEIPYLRNMVRYADILLPLLRTLLYVGCLLHTAVCTPGYCRYLREVVYPYRRAKPTGERFFASRLWLLWCLVPGFGFAAPLFGARLANNRRVRRLSTVLLGISAAAVMLTIREFSLYLEYGRIWTKLMKLVPHTGVAAVLNMGYLLLSIFVYVEPAAAFLLSAAVLPDAVEARRANRTADTAAQLSYASRSWRIRNGLWQILSLLPFIGGLGLIAGGTGAKHKRAMRIGIMHLAGTMLFMGIMIALFYVGTQITERPYGSFASLFFENGYSDGIRVMLQRRGLYLLWCTGVLLGCIYRREILLKRAEVLGGCRSRIDQDIQLTKRFRTLGALPSDVPEVPKTSETVDLNTCEPDALRTIPGMSAAAADRVLQYRSENGAIRSERELLNVLDEKPHRAVQILEKVALSVPADGPAESRRMIDL